ncbi:MAG TPA: hypothetical protein VHP37_26550 [Burkholderiales bacterium]|nr:hypothetical protein [Burkholderiales bacterium]
MLPVIVSAASPEYFRCLVQLALSVTRTQPRGTLRLVAYDLGFSPRQRLYFERRFPAWELRTFDFDRHPPHLRIRHRLVNTNAWKPVIVREVLAESDAPLLWLDSATVVLQPLTPVFDYIRRTSLYTPFGGASSLEALTHPATLAALGVTRRVASERQRASGVFGADPRRATARELVEGWANACLDERIAIPPGADHRAHRFDQSVLNALLYPLAAREGLTLTTDEIDVSSAQPTPLYRTRNKVKNWVPVAADPLARAWFAAYRAIDVALIRRKSSRAAGTAAPRADA